jgi:hypothetical protein
MARIRYLKPEFFQDDDLAEIDFWVRLLYAGLWTIADKGGRLEDRPKKIKAVLFPYDKVDIEKGLCELCRTKTTGKPFILRYNINGEGYIQILQWTKHQKPHNTEKESIIPEPPINSINILKEKENGDGECVVQNDTVRTPLNNGLITVKEKQTYSEFVKMTGVEYNKLLTKFGDKTTKEYIDRLNNYIGSKGKRYNSHYYTILQWYSKDLKDGKVSYPINDGLTVDQRIAKSHDKRMEMVKQEQEKAHGIPKL